MVRIRKALIWVAIIVTVVLVAGGLYVYVKIWPGLKPAIGLRPQPPKVKPIPGAVNTTGLPLTIPAGFKIETFASGLGPVRFMAFDSQGVLAASVTGDGKVVALPDLDRNGQADKTVTLLEGLTNPHGLVFRSGSLYIAETGHLMKYDYKTSKPGDISIGAGALVTDLPASGRHFTRTITFGSDGKLYVSAGSSTNNDPETEPRRAAITQYSADGSGGILFATGLRNSVGLAWHPVTKELWATDNGRDFMGDDLPPDEINIIVKGGDYGWPYAYGNRLPDPAYNNAARAAATLPPKIEIQAHSAPLGLCFYTGETWGAAYKNDLFVAYHGSWNRTVPTGYKVVRYDLAGPTYEQVAGQSDFISGWLTPDGALGRPVDIVQASDGALYVSDDKSGTIYKISKLKR